MLKNSIVLTILCRFRHQNKLFSISQFLGNLNFLKKTFILSTRAFKHFYLQNFTPHSANVKQSLNSNSFLSITYIVHVTACIRLCSPYVYTTISVGMDAENTHHWGKDHCMVGLQFNKTGTDQKRKCALICVIQWFSYIQTCKTGYQLYSDPSPQC